jgi:hypothetical protein
MSILWLIVIEHTLIIPCLPSTSCTLSNALSLNRLDAYCRRNDHIFLRIWKVSFMCVHECDWDKIWNQLTRIKNHSYYSNSIVWSNSVVYNQCQWEKDTCCHWMQRSGRNTHFSFKTSVIHIHLNQYNTKPIFLLSLAVMRGVIWYQWILYHSS